jgi:hypothetical protein
MKTVLTIGYTQFLLPSSVNVNALLGALQKAVPVEERYVDGRHVYYRRDRDTEVSVKLVADADIRDSKKLKALPEHASPDAHNTFGS